MEHLTSTSSQTVRIRTAGPFTRLLSLFLLILFIILAVLIAIPLILLATIVVLIFMLYFKIKNTLTRAKSPNGPLDGRHNVKVVNRDD